jgi:hypothetical protein
MEDLEDMDEQDSRIHEILGDNSERTRRNAKRYREYLLKNLTLPVTVTGMEDFPWEEPYVFGGWSQREYEKLKETNPSHTDTFELQGLNPPDGHDDVVAVIKRISDGKRFKIGLSWLCCADKNDKAFAVLDDYAYWHTNF